jgi:hypothetical protein
VQQKSVKDQMLRVFIRHVDYDHLHLEEGVRLFVAESTVRSGEAAGSKRIDGFVLVDPLWRDGKVYGYVTSLNRMRRDGHHGAWRWARGLAGRLQRRPACAACRQGLTAPRPPACRPPTYSAAPLPAAPTCPLALTPTPPCFPAPAPYPALQAP